MKKYLHPYYIYLLKKIILTRYWSFINKVYAKYWHVKLGYKTSFYRLCYFRKVPNSMIEIGDRCNFDSNRKSNRIGNNSACLISTLKKNAIISIGDNCGFSGTIVSSAKSIVIGNNVRCGANTLITDTDWHTDDPRTSPDAAIVIEDNVWLGYGVKVLKGVKIGKNSLIGACSVVVKDIPPNVIAAGNPCKTIKQI
jgi:acetyltransferase-like isoleucine patch superfamily enzyme